MGLVAGRRRPLAARSGRAPAAYGAAALLGARYTDGTRHPGPADSAVATRVLRQILLVVVLGVAVARRERGVALSVGGQVDRRAVLRPDVVALAHALGRIVALPEETEQLVVGDLIRAIGDQNRLGVPGPPAADFLVGGVRSEAAGVAHRRGVDAGRLPEVALGAPEAAHPEDDGLHALGEGRLERSAEHEMGVRHRKRADLAAGEGVGGGGHVGLVTEEEAHWYRRRD